MATWQLNPDTLRPWVDPATGRPMIECCCFYCRYPQYQNIWPQNSPTYWQVSTNWIRIAVEIDVRYADSVKLYLRQTAQETRAWLLEDTDTSPTYGAAWEVDVHLETSRIFFVPTRGVPAGTSLWARFEYYFVIENTCGKSTTTPTRELYIQKYEPSSGVDCNSCAPTLKNTWTVVLSGMPGALGNLNGSHQVTHVSGCEWKKTISATRFIRLNWSVSDSKWYIRAQWTTTCWGSYVGGSSVCDPDGATYTCSTINCGGVACLGQGTVS